MCQKWIPLGEIHKRTLHFVLCSASSKTLRNKIGKNADKHKTAFQQTQNVKSLSVKQWSSRSWQKNGKGCEVPKRSIYYNLHKSVNKLHTELCVSAASVVYVWTSAGMLWWRCRWSKTMVKQNKKGAGAGENWSPVRGRTFISSRARAQLLHIWLLLQSTSSGHLRERQREGVDNQPAAGPSHNI